MEKDGKLKVAYEEKDNDSLSNYVPYVSVSLRILISDDLAFFTTVVKKYVSRKQCHWCKLSPAELENCDHEKGDMWSIQLIKDNLEEQRINLDMIPSEKKDMYCLCYLIQFHRKLHFSLLHSEIDVGNKIIESFYRWI